VTAPQVRHHERDEPADRLVALDQGRGDPSGLDANMCS
jgi:hypothetical protein